MNMKIIEMKQFRKLKIGFENEPNLSIQNYDKLEQTLTASGNLINSKRTVIVELTLATHASSYGLLGATFLPSNPNEEKTLSVEVRFSNEKIPFHESLSIHQNYSYLGLEKVYAQSILSRAIEFFSSRSVPAGKLIFDTAAYCEVGSSPLIFSCIVEILLEILFNHYDKVSDQELEEICEKHLQKRYTNP